jgi:alpha-glucosidase
MLALPGGAYVYQGDELGLPEVTDLPDGVLQDPTYLRSGGARRGRDGCRVPIPWSGEAPPFEFGPAGNSWLPQPDQWAELTVERQSSDPASMLNLYRRALRLRRELLTPPEPPAPALTWIEAGRHALAFLRGPDFVCVVNTGDQPVELPAELGSAGGIVLASGPVDADKPLPGDCAVWCCPRSGREDR